MQNGRRWQGSAEALHAGGKESRLAGGPTGMPRPAATREQPRQPPGCRVVRGEMARSRTPLIPRSEEGKVGCYRGPGLQARPERVKDEGVGERESRSEIGRRVPGWWEIWERAVRLERDKRE